MTASFERRHVASAAIVDVADETVKRHPPV